MLGHKKTQLTRAEVHGNFVHRQLQHIKGQRRSQPSNTSVASSWWGENQQHGKHNQKDIQTGKGIYEIRKSKQVTRFENMFPKTCKQSHAKVVKRFKNCGLRLTKVHIMVAWEGFQHLVNCRLHLSRSDRRLRPSVRPTD